MHNLSESQKNALLQLKDWWAKNKGIIFKTQDDFADKAGIARSTLGRYIRGEVYPPATAVNKIFSITGIESFKPNQYESELTTKPLALPEVISTPLLGAEPSSNTQGVLLGGATPSIQPEKIKLFRIAVSGDVDLFPKEYNLVDTRAFQRLRSIKQLGTAYLVYPSATHTRFEHSIGTVFEANRIVTSLCEGDKPWSEKLDRNDIPLIRLAALLHDIGHISFGHTLEDETSVIESKHDSEDRRNTLLRNSHLGTLVKEKYGQDQLDLLLKIMSTEHQDVWKLGEHAYIADIVNNTLCADLLDYLKRDVYFCNLQDSFGDRFMKYLCLQYVPNDPKLVQKEKGPEKSKRLVVRVWSGDSSKYRRDVLSELVDLLRTRYTLGEKVYYHSAKVSTSAMVARAVASAMKPGTGSALTLNDLIKMGDDQLLARLAVDSNSAVAKRLADCLLNHRLYKLAYTVTRMEAEAVPGIEWASELVRRYSKNVDERSDVEDQLANLCGLEPGDVLIYCTGLDMAKKYARMLVDWKGTVHQLREIDDEATSVALKAIERSHELLWNFRVFVNPRVQDPRTIQILRDFCDVYFTPPEAGNDDRRLEAAYRNLVGSEMGQEGSDKIVSELVTAHRGKRSISREDVRNAILKFSKAN